jgi:hypothetical protein
MRSQKQRDVVIDLVRKCQLPVPVPQPIELVDRALSELLTDDTRNRLIDYMEAEAAMRRLLRALRKRDGQENVPPRSDAELSNTATDGSSGRLETLRLLLPPTWLAASTEPARSGQRISRLLAACLVWANPAQFQEMLAFRPASDRHPEGIYEFPVALGFAMGLWRGNWSRQIYPRATDFMQAAWEATAAPRTPSDRAAAIHWLVSIIDSQNGGPVIPEGDPWPPIDWAAIASASSFTAYESFS